MTAPRESKEEMMAELLLINPEKLAANDYNPNTMTDERFAELVEEVKHLGRLPKPVVARPNGDGSYVIVDGEHGWRAAQKAGLDEIAVEVVDADNFEARRQTYKRNQHGDHDPVLLGRMFKQMVEDRSLSQRGLAKEINVSEGTVRNALLYADAFEVSNCYALEQDLDGDPAAEITKLAVRQLRAYLALPDPIRQYWLRDGADLRLLDGIAGGDDVPRFKKSNVQMPYEEWTELIEFGFAPVLEKRRFSRAAQLWELWAWHRENNVLEVGPYLVALAHHGWLTTFVPDRVPVIEVEKPKGWPVWASPPYKVAISLEDFESLLDRADEANVSDAQDLVGMLAAKASLVHGDDFNNEDPRVALARQKVDRAPEFIRDAKLGLQDQLTLTQFDADLPPEILEKVKRGAIETLLKRDQIVSGELGLPEDHPIVTGWADITADEAIRRACEELGREEALKERDELFGDREKLMAAVMEAMKKKYQIREEKIEKRPAHEVLHKRLAALPWPEFRLLAAHLIGQETPAVGLWMRAVKGETPKK